MSLQELVHHVQSEFADLDQYPRAPREPRAPIPPWLENEDFFELPQGEEPLFDPESVGQTPANGAVGSQYGVDALAYYRPFHFHWRWGIFVREAGIADLAEEIKGAPLGFGDAHVYSMAWQVLLEHERLHFFAEVSGSRAELVARTRLYEPFFSRREPSELEEALANANACRSLRDLPRTLRVWMRCQGPGYRDFEKYLAGTAFDAGKLHLVQAMLDHLHVGYSETGLGPLNYLYSNAAKLRLPVFLVPESHSPRLNLGRPFPKEHGIQIVVHTNDHPPPHIHIRVVQQGAETRYKWPDLVPVDGDEALGAKWRKALDTYLTKHRSAIGRKVKTVYGL